MGEGWERPSADRAASRARRTEGITVSAVAAAASSSFVDLEIAPWHWAAALALIAALLAADLVLHRGHAEPTFRRSVIESAVWVSCGLGFAFIVLAAWGGQAFGEYLSGYVIEKSLSVDNVFVWAIIFSTFAIPLRYQHRVLFWGIFGALALRAVFIVAGTALIERFWWLLVAFGVVLVASGIKVVRHRDDEGQHGHDRAVKLVGRFLPVRKELAAQSFVIREHGRLVATPLLAALVVVEVTDVVFAVDSVPAILAVSREPFLVFTSNAFAILGLRAMYFLLGGAREKFHYLSHALGAVLIFVGVKMAVSRWWHMPTVASLAVIVLILTAAIVFSVRKNRREAVQAAPKTAEGVGSGSTMHHTGSLVRRETRVARPGRDPRHPDHRIARVRAHAAPAGRTPGRAYDARVPAIPAGHAARSRRGVRPRQRDRRVARRRTLSDPPPEGRGDGPAPERGERGERTRGRRAIGRSGTA
jgi:tellurite resistance protein TerC